MCLNKMVSCHRLLIRKINLTNMDNIENKKCKKCGSEEIVLVEYAHDHPEHYDGISEIKCLKCGARFGRWSGKELGPDETEKRNGRSK